jgi:hypothetical protein
MSISAPDAEALKASRLAPFGEAALPGPAT